MTGQASVQKAFTSFHQPSPSCLSDTAALPLIRGDGFSKGELKLWIDVKEVVLNILQNVKIQTPLIVRSVVV